MISLYVSHGSSAEVNTGGGHCIVKRITTVRCNEKYIWMMFPSKSNTETET